MKRFPVITLSVVLLSIIATLWGSAASWLIFDRAEILHGDVWRLLTGNLVHLSLTHMVGDLLVFTVAGTLIEWRLGRQVIGLYLAMALAIGTTLLAFAPDLMQFGGISGLGYGCLIYLGLQHFAVLAGRALVAIVVIKMVGDLVFTTSFIAWVSPDPFIPVPLSHLAGVLIAGTAFMITAKEN